MELDEARRFALALPEVTEEPHFEKASFRIRGRIFATVPAGGQHLHVLVDEHETLGAVADDPEAFEELWWGSQLRGVRVNLAAADAGQVCELLEEAWRNRAPKRLLAAFDAAHQSPP